MCQQHQIVGIKIESFYMAFYRLVNLLFSTKNVAYNVMKYNTMRTEYLFLVPKTLHSAVLKNGMI